MKSRHSNSRSAAPLAVASLMIALAGASPYAHAQTAVQVSTDKKPSSMAQVAQQKPASTTAVQVSTDKKPSSMAQVAQQKPASTTAVQVSTDKKPAQPKPAPVQAAPVQQVSVQKPAPTQTAPILAKPAPVQQVASQKPAPVQQVAPVRQVSQQKPAPAEQLAQPKPGQDKPMLGAPAQQKPRADRAQQIDSDKQPAPAKDDAHSQYYREQAKPKPNPLQRLFGVQQKPAQPDDKDDERSAGGLQKKAAPSCRLDEAEVPRGGRLDVSGENFGHAPVVRIEGRVARVLERKATRISVQVARESDGGAVTVQADGVTVQCGTLIIIGKNR
jgi:hypothetical protein